MSGTRPGLAARAYRACLWLLPPSVRHHDAREMVAAFADLWEHAPGAVARASLALRVFGRLPRVIALEWLDELGLTKNQSGGTMGGWGRNLRYALRTLRKAPSFTATTIVLIGLGIGAVTTIFTIVDHVLLRPLPYPEADRLVTVQQGAYSLHAYRAFQETGSVEVWAAAYDEDANITGQGDPVRVRQARTSERLFSILGATPAAGRLFVDDDFTDVGVAVLTHAAWVDLFGSAPEAVGRTLRVDGEPVRVVGVLAEDFEPPLNAVGADVALWRPIDWSRQELQDPGFHTLQVVGRLAGGATLADLQRELDAAAAQLGTLYPQVMLDRQGNPRAMPAVGLQDATTQSVRTGLHLLLGAVGLLLLVACLNVAHLFLARGLGRAREMAVRRALGAGTGGVAKQLLVESLVLGAAGGALGLAAATLGLRGYVALAPGALPRTAAVTVDLRVLLFAAAASVITAVVFGLAPALRTLGRDLTVELKGSGRSSTTGRGTTRLRGALVVVEVALSLVLVAQAALLFRSYVNVQSTRIGFERAGVWTIPLTPTGFETPADYVREMEEIRASLAGLSGVESATFGLTMPFQFTGGGRCCWGMPPIVDGQERPDVRMALQPVTAEYFETLGLPLLAGSVWTEASEVERPVPAVVSERLAIDLFGSAGGALGRVTGRPDRLPIRIVGVVGDTPHYGLDQPVPAAAYVPVSVVPFTIPLAHMAVRLRSEAPEGIDRMLREAVWQAAPDLPVPTVRPMEAWIEASLAGRRFDSALFGAFAVIALLLAVAGLYGTLLYSVRQQSRELGIRLALGAARARVQRDVVGRGVGLTLVGAVLGLVAVWALGRFVEARLYEVEAADPAILGGAAAVLLVAAALASWLPARRAGSTDPLEALRAE